MTKRYPHWFEWETKPMSRKKQPGCNACAFFCENQCCHPFDKTQNLLEKRQNNEKNCHYFLSRNELTFAQFSAIYNHFLRRKVFFSSLSTEQRTCIILGHSNIVHSDHSGECYICARCGEERDRPEYDKTVIFGECNSKNQEHFKNTNWHDTFLCPVDIFHDYKKYQCNHCELFSPEEEICYFGKCSRSDSSACRRFLLRKEAN